MTGYHIHNNTDAKKNLPSGYAIGANTYARTGSIQIGDHTLEKNNIAIGDTTAKQLRQFGVASTTLGTNSYTGGGYATTIGSYNVQSSQYEARDFWDTLGNSTKNAFATVVGTLNSNESMQGGLYSGVSNVITGTANKVTKSNGSIVLGAGNTVSGSYESGIYNPSNKNFKTVTEMQGAFIDGIRKQGSGGAVMVIGGGNQVTDTKRSQILGVNNKIDKGEYVFLDGFNTTVTDSTHATTLGFQDKLNGVQDSQVIGDKRKLTKVSNSVIVGSAEDETELNVSKATVLGYNANVGKEGGVALGYGSIANTEAGITGWAPAGVTIGGGNAWKSTAGAVSVGDVAKGITRQITGVAAGTEMTDAVNVAQLRAVAEKAGTGSGAVNIKAGDGIKLVKGDDGTYTISANLKGKNTGTNEVVITTDAEEEQHGPRYATARGDGSIDNGNPLNIRTYTTISDQDGTKTRFSDTDVLKVVGDGTNLITKADGTELKIQMNPDIQVDSVTIKNGGPTINNGGIDMHNHKITNVADGEVAPGSKDAVNGGQLYEYTNGMNNRISRLDTKINRVGASSAAMASLHPLDFDPDDKLSFAAGFGNYRDANGLAVGAFYRPTERVMYNVSGSFGNGENMIGTGVSFKLGRTSEVTKAMKTETIQTLRSQVAAQQAQLDAQNKKIAALEAMVRQLAAAK